MVLRRAFLRKAGHLPHRRPGRRSGIRHDRADSEQGTDERLREALRLGEVADRSVLARAMVAWLHCRWASTASGVHGESATPTPEDHAVDVAEWNSDINALAILSRSAILRRASNSHRSGASAPGSLPGTVGSFDVRRSNDRSDGSARTEVDHGENRGERREASRSARPMSQRFTSTCRPRGP